MTLSSEALSEPPTSLVQGAESAILMFASFMSLSTITALGLRVTFGMPLLCIAAVHSDKHVPNWKKIWNNVGRVKDV